MSRSERRQLQKGNVTVRVGNRGDTINLKVQIHRWPPADALIKSIQLTAKPEGRQLRWQLAFTCSWDRRLKEPHPEEGVVGIDIGWRRNDDESLTLGHTMDTDGAMDVIRLPASFVSRQRKVEELTSILDNYMTLWLENTPEDAMPESVRPLAEQWQHTGRVRDVDPVALHRECLALRCRGVALPPMLALWFKRYAHLSTWRDAQRARVQRQRREHYRLLAQQIAQQYRVVVLEKADLSRMARTKQTDRPNALGASARSNRVLAGLSYLRGELTDQVRKAGGRVIEVPAAGTSKMCRIHPETKLIGEPGQMDLYCPECDDVVHRDINAAGNILDRGLAVLRGELSSAAENPGSARVSGGAGSGAVLPIAAAPERGI